jgi:hypothetical protein
MKLHAQEVPYSSIVGGGLTLIAEDKSAAFIVNFMGTTKGITKEETRALATQFAAWVNERGLEVPDRE